MNEADLLVDLERATLRYFLETAHPETGLVPDRAKADGSSVGSVASVAATGFGLTALAIGATHGWVGQAEARARCERTLAFLVEEADSEQGFLYHFLDTTTGRRRWRSEASTIDTALAVFGGLSAGAAFGGTVAELALTLAALPRWAEFLDPAGRIRHGWTPESGFLEWSWDRFSEHWGMTALALASPTSPVSPATWLAWERSPWVDYAGERFLHHPPLFTHQFPQAWIDWRDYTDVSGVNFFQNAAAATRAQRRFCRDLADTHPGYGAGFWGLTSSDSKGGYVDWGGPPVNGSAPDPRIDGTVVPCAAAGSLPFEPDLCLEVLHNLKCWQGGRAWGCYGFADALHPLSGWVAPDCIGIDQGITCLMAENLRTGLVWDWLRPLVPTPRMPTA